MTIRDYKESDEKAWLYCRVLSFLDSSYYNDVKTTKESYSHPNICLVAEEDNQIIGFIDIEIDSDDLTGNQGQKGAVIWHLGVLPAYRKKKIAQQLWAYAKERLLHMEVHYCEAWTQEDIPANQFYKNNGFQLDDSQTWIRCYIAGKSCLDMLKDHFLDAMYGPEEIIIDVPKNQQTKWEEISYRIDEVRLYKTYF